MHVAYLREVYIHPDEPWCSSTLCVRVTCKVYKSVRRDDNYMREPCHPFLKTVHIFARDHSLGISPVSRDCWKRWAKTGPNSVAISFRTLVWSSSGPKASEGFKLLRIRIRNVYVVTRQNDNHSPGPWPGRLVPSSHQRSELRNTILGTFSRGDKRVWKCIPIPNGLGKKVTLINMSVSNGNLICHRMIFPATPNKG